jgi:hypothetical protein
VGKSEGKSHLEYPSVDGSIKLSWISGSVLWGGMYWSDVAQVRDRWRALVNAAMNLRVP